MHTCVCVCVYIYIYTYIYIYIYIYIHTQVALRDDLLDPPGHQPNLAVRGRPRQLLIISVMIIVFPYLPIISIIISSSST